MFVEAAQNLVTATDLMAEFLHVSANRDKLAKDLRDLEHAGDAVTRRVIHELNSTFVTPFDREDIYQLATLLDDVIDSMEAAADFVVLTGLDALPSEMTRQVRGALGRRRQHRHRVGADDPGGRGRPRAQLDGRLTATTAGGRPGGRGRRARPGPARPGRGPAPTSRPAGPAG